MGNVERSNDLRLFRPTHPPHTYLTHDLTFPKFWLSSQQKPIQIEPAAFHVWFPAKLVFIFNKNLTDPTGPESWAFSIKKCF